MRARKHAILARAGERVLDLERRAHMHSGYDDWIAAGLNNAYLASIGTYSECVPGFERLLKQNNDELLPFYAAVRRVSHDAHARQALCASQSAPALRPPASATANAAATATAVPGR